MTKIPQEALNAAMKEAVAQKVFPGVSIGTDDYMAKWDAMARVLEAAFRAAGIEYDRHDSCTSSGQGDTLPPRKPLTDAEIDQIGESIKDLGERVDRNQRGEDA